MSFGVRARRATDKGAGLAESLMVDICRVVRVERVQQPDYTTQVREVLVWSGPCKVQTYEPDSIERQSGGRYVVTQEDRLHVPNSAGPFEIGDVAYVEGYARPYRIDGLIRKTFQTAQRLKVTMISNREEVPGVPSAP